MQDQIKQEVQRCLRFPGRNENVEVHVVETSGGIAAAADSI